MDDFSVQLSESQRRMAERLGLKLTELTAEATKKGCVACGGTATKGAVSVVAVMVNGEQKRRIYVYGLCEECDPMSAVLPEAADARGFAIRQALHLPSPN